MKTRNKQLKIILSVALVIFMALTMLVPAAAEAGDLTITIHNNTGLPQMKPNQFTVYQLFTGKPGSSKKDATRPNDWNARVWDSFPLENIGWGKAVISPENVVNALKGLSRGTDEWAFDKGDNAFKGIADYDANDPDASAQDIAEVLGLNNTNAFMQKFVDFLMDGNFLQASEIKGEVTCDEENPGHDHKDDTLTITIPKDETGYYIFAETGEQASENDAVSEYIVAVMGDQEIDLKADIPTVDKGIITNGNDINDGSEGNVPANGDAAGVGDTITFQLKGTLPANFMDYDEFKYIFNDTLSEGLTYLGNDRVKIYVKQDGKVYTISNSECGMTDNNVSSKALKFEFTDLRKKEGLQYTAVDGVSQTGTLQLDETAEIYITYDAQINDSAKRGVEGNLNDVYIEYSNNPNSTGEGKTNKDTVYVYTFGLDLTKVGSDAEHDTEGLEDAAFVLSRNNNTEFAKFTDFEGGRRIVEWTETTLDAIKENPEYQLKSGENGKIPLISNLDEGTYTLTEVVTPDGYNTMDPFKFNVKATIDENGKLESVTYTTYYANGEQREQTVYEAADQSVNPDEYTIYQNGEIKDDLVNDKIPDLPFTGGIGTTMFYVLGALLIAGAVAYLVIVSKRNKKAKENA